MENKIRQHQKTQDLRGQVSELMENALNFSWTVEKMRDMISCLLKEHESWNTDNFRKRDLNNTPHRSSNDENSHVRH